MSYFISLSLGAWWKQAYYKKCPETLLTEATTFDSEAPMFGCTPIMDLEWVNALSLLLLLLLGACWRLVPGSNMVFGAKAGC
jgi:hypothetical protein